MKNVMYFNVGPWKYRVTIASKPIVWRDRREKLGTCHEHGKHIKISPACHKENRLAVLLHELTHAWVWAVGEPRDLERWCDMQGTIFVATMKELLAQGGEAALMQMQTRQTRDPIQRLRKSERLAITC